LNSHSVIRFHAFGFWNLDLRDVRSLIENSLPKEETNREFIVVARRAHRYGNRPDRPDAFALLPDLNFQRIFNRNAVVGAKRDSATYSMNLDERGMERVGHLSISTNP
jgi:hypothetical protein